MPSSSSLCDATIVQCRWLPCLPGDAALPRNGLCLTLSNGQTVGCGEAWPLPSWSTETYEEILSCVHTWPTQSPLLHWQSLAQAAGTPPSLRWALSAALLELRAPRTAQQPLKHHVGFLRLDQDSRWEEHLVTWAEHRFPLTKLKVGRLSPQEALSRIEKILQAWPWVRVRLDTNRGWAMRESLALARDLPRERLDYWEEPVAPSLLESWAEETGLPFALDETLRDPQVSCLPPTWAKATAWVLKPLLLGSVDECLAFQGRARDLGIRCVWSSCWESPSTVVQYAALAPSHEHHGWGPLLYHGTS